jgi:hypothetical protein
VKCDTRDITGVAFEGKDWVGVGGLDIVKLHIMMAGSRKEALVGGDAKSIDLRFGMLNCARTDT